MLSSGQMEFVGWLRAELEERGMSQADLVRASGLSPAAVSRIITGTRAPGLAACKGIARALKLPTDIIYKHAGLLPLTGERNQRREFLEFLAEQLDDAQYEELKHYINFLLTRNNRNNGENRVGKLE